MWMEENDVFLEFRRFFFQQTLKKIIRWLTGKKQYEIRENIT